MLGVDVPSRRSAKLQIAISAMPNHSRGGLESAILFKVSFFIWLSLSLSLYLSLPPLISLSFFLL